MHFEAKIHKHENKQRNSQVFTQHHTNVMGVQTWVSHTFNFETYEKLNSLQKPEKDYNMLATSTDII